MKVIALILVLCAAIAFGYPQVKVNRKLDSVSFYLYTQSNPSTAQEIDTDNLQSLRNSNFNQNHPTRFIVHGWGGSQYASINRKLREAFLATGQNYNIFVVDWSVYASSSNYAFSQGKCSVAGDALAEFIDWLNKTEGMSLQTLSLIGHSLGAHVVGFAGKSVKVGQVDTIIGLDPAMPLFNYTRTDKRLCDTDAVYVETIHTNGGVKGFYNPIGKASFYPNGGKKQPGCGTDLNGACSHNRVVDLYAEAIKLGVKNAFASYDCKDFDALKEEKCSSRASGVKMGDPANRNKAAGVYYLTTNSRSPYGIGGSF